jgi:hypothetical protein
VFLEEDLPAMKDTAGRAGIHVRYGEGDIAIGCRL